jgi:NADPH-dependent curcumin reductase CurA
MELTNLAWRLKARPVGKVAESDFELVASELPQIGPGEILCETAYLSVAPVMRLYMRNETTIEPPLALGDVMHGRGVGTVIASRHPDFVIGDVVQGRFGWQQYAKLSGDAAALTFKVTQRVAPISTALGPLGMTGWTAFVGLKQIGRLQAGQTLVVSGAAGGVGSIVGPVAANLGAPAIGIAGSDEKCAMLVDRLGYMAAINYRTENVEARLAQLCPDGINVFFDNVGGPILDAALANLALYGRVVLCGRISQYLLDAGETYRLANWGQVGAKRGAMEAFFIYDYADHFREAETTMAEWIAAGTFPYAQDISEGIETMPAALISLFDGTNRGKRLVRVKAGAV